MEIETVIREEAPEVTTTLFQFGSQSGFNPIVSQSNSISATLKLVSLDERKRS
jgi:hypothetical protein